MGDGTGRHSAYSLAKSEGKWQLLNQVEGKALSLEKAHRDGATVTCHYTQC